MGNHPHRHAQDGPRSKGSAGKHYYSKRDMQIIQEKIEHQKKYNAMHGDGPAKANQLTRSMNTGTAG
jgi:hypothetical protein